MECGGSPYTQKVGVLLKAYPGSQVTRKISLQWHYTSNLSQTKSRLFTMELGQLGFYFNVSSDS